MCCRFGPYASAVVSSSSCGILLLLFCPIRDWLIDWLLIMILIRPTLFASKLDQSNWVIHLWCHVVHACNDNSTSKNSQLFVGFTAHKTNKNKTIPNLIKNKLKFENEMADIFAVWTWGVCIACECFVLFLPLSPLAILPSFFVRCFTTLFSLTIEH